MKIIQRLIEKRDELRNGDPEVCKWAKEQEIYYAFSEEDYLLIVRKKEVCLTQDGNAISSFLWDGTPRENLPEEKQERTVLYFIGKKNVSGTGFWREVPLPCGFSITEILCQDNVFTIQSDSEHADLVGTFLAMLEALTLAESLYYSERGLDEETILRCCYEYLAEDHQKYMKKAAQEKRYLSGRNNRKAKKENFYLDENGEYVCNFRAELWGRKTDVYAACPKKAEQMDKMLDRLSERLNFHIKWIDQQKKQIYKAILDDDMVPLACDWMENSEVVGEDGKTYYELEDGSLLAAPITEDLFVDSLYIGGINVCCEEDEILFDMFLVTEPDFFAGHSIEVFITATPEPAYSIKVNGLAG